MTSRKNIIGSAVLAAFPALFMQAQAQSITVTVSANPLGKDESMQVLTPAKVLSGPELRAKVGSSLGETLSGELGVSASGFGAGASRPIIRGLEGPRVMILQNGMSVADVSGLSNDHAVASEASGAQQIEILRGPSALLYGSGAIGGLVNVVDGSIPTVLSKQVSGEAELKSGSVNGEKSGSFFLDGAAGDFGIHAEANTRISEDYKIPGYADVHGQSQLHGTLPSSFAQEHSVGAGVSLIKSWGHIGAAVQDLSNHYGIPTDEHSYIDMKQTRFDLDSEINHTMGVFNALKFKLGASDYKHTEKANDGTPITDFTNRSLESRVTLSHANWDGWEGSMGAQTESSKFSALSSTTGRSDTVPTTQTTSTALFVVEQKAIGEVIASFGGRVESVERSPEEQFHLAHRRFELNSASIGAMWQLHDG